MAINREAMTMAGGVAIGDKKWKQWLVVGGVDVVW